MTIKEVARIAGVSPAAVSRYLNGGPLSAEKKERIAAAVKETGYRPNLMALAMRTGNFRQIGVIVPRIYSESVSQILDGISDELSRHGYMTVIGCSDAIEEREIQYLKSLQDNRVAGIILMGTAMSCEIRKALSDCRVPVVVTGQDFDGVPCVFHDDLGAMRELTQRMIEKGSRVLAYIGVREDDIAAGKRRREGVQKAMQEAGLDPGRLLTRISSFDAREGRERMEELLDEYPGVDGVLCATDTIALGAVQAIRRRGLCIPLDVRIAGIGGSWITEIPQPALASIRYQYEKCGIMAARMLLQRITGQEQGIGDRIMLDYRYVEGGSI